MYKLNRLQCDPVAPEGGTATNVEVPFSGSLVVDDPSSSGGDDSIETPPEKSELDTQQEAPPEGTIKPSTAKGPQKPPKELSGEELIGDLKGDDEIVSEKPKVEGKVEAKPKQAAATTPQRDYTIFGDENSPRVQALKKAPNSVFAEALAMATEIKQLKEANTGLTSKYEEASKGIVKLPDSYRAHEKAYIFDPEYSALRFNLNAATKVKQHYKDNLDKVAAGEPIRDIIDIKDDGSFTYSDPIEASAVTNSMLETMREHIGNANTSINTFSGQINELKQGHVAQYTQLKTGIESKTKEFYPWFGDEKVAEGIKVSIVNPQTKKEEELSVKEISNRFRSVFPKNLHGELLFEPLIASLAANVLAKAGLNKTQQTKQVSQQLKKDEAAAETTDTGKGSIKAKASDSNKIGSLADMRSDD